jgi:hypothetical protein
MKTLWEKEVLMISGKFKFPPMKEGHSYRILFGGGSHVGVGDGPALYINGRKIGGHFHGLRRGQGGRPRGNLIPQDMVSAFAGGEVELAAIGFLRMHKRTKVTGNFLNIWFEEMKNPPVTEAQAWDGLKQIPMQSSAWQQAQDTDVAEFVSQEGLFRFDGKFVANAKMLGTWTPLGKVATIDAFKPDGEIDQAKPRYRSITLQDKGFTDITTHYWSGNTLMDLSRGSMALKMNIKNVDGADYLFVEAGGFTFYYERQTYKQPRTWKSSWFVLKKK